MKFIVKSKLDLFFETALNQLKLYITVDTEEGKASYKVWKSGMKLSAALNTTRSAKDFFFPQTESLVDFKINGKSIEIIDPRRETEDFAVFGVRACDARSFGVLDKVFLSEPVDTYYKNRREHGLIITMTCRRPAETCFCGAFGIDPTNPEGDVHFTEIECDDYAVDTAKNIVRAIMDKLPLANLSTDAFGGGKTKDLFNSEAWAELSESCLGCGACTFVCPTCQCYDIRDFDTGHGIKRFRCWDSCMYSDFTKMAHGNPRLTQKERFRQRFMHKLVYFPENNNGEFGCVGCGRCLAVCPISMNIVKVMKKLGEEE